MTRKQPDRELEAMAADLAEACQGLSPLESALDCPRDARGIWRRVGNRGARRRHLFDIAENLKG